MNSGGSQTRKANRLSVETLAFLILHKALGITACHRSSNRIHPKSASSISLRPTSASERRNIAARTSRGTHKRKFPGLDGHALSKSLVGILQPKHGVPRVHANHACYPMGFCPRALNEGLFKRPDIKRRGFSKTLEDEREKNHNVSQIYYLIYNGIWIPEDAKVCGEGNECAYLNTCP